MENRFKDARTRYNQHGLQSTKDVAGEAGITKSLIEDLESNVGNQRNVGYLTIKKLAQYYGVSSDYLLGLSNTPSTKEDIRAACKTTGLSDTAIKAIRSMGDIKFKDGVLHRAEFQEVISCMLEDPRFSSMIPHVIEAERLRTSPEIDQDTTAMELTQSMGKVESLGFVVLRREDARQFHLRQAAQVFLSVVSDIGVGASNGK